MKSRYPSNHKMKTIQLLTIFMLIINTTYCQSNNSNVRIYYQLINNAELSILNKDFALASKYYDKSFKLKFPNGKDLYNAFLVAYYNLDSIRARKHYNQLAYMGLGKHVFRDTNRNYSFYKYVSNDYDSFYNSGAISEMPVYGMKLKSILERDQQVRKPGMNNPNLLKDPVYSMQVKQVDSTNIEDLKVYINTYGFPSFKQVGFWDGTAPNNPGTLWKVLWHYRPYDSNIDSLVIKAVLEGNFRPDDWATIISTRTNAETYQYHMKVWNEVRPLSKKELQKINQSRAKIYLESLSDYSRKWKVAQELQELSHTQFNSNVFTEDPNLKYQFVFLNQFLIMSPEHLKSGHFK